MHFQLEIIRHEPISFRLFHLRPHRCRSSLFSKKELTTFFPYVYFFSLEILSPSSARTRTILNDFRWRTKRRFDCNTMWLDDNSIWNWFSLHKRAQTLVDLTTEKICTTDAVENRFVRFVNCSVELHWMHTPSNRSNQNNHYYTSLNIPLWRLDSQQVSRSSQLIVHRYLSSSPVNRSTRLSIRRYIESRR